MNHDLIGAVELTASAAIVIAALASAFGHDAARRIRVAAWLSVWFVLVVILAATRALYYEHGLGTPGLGFAVVLPIVILFWSSPGPNPCAKLFTAYQCRCWSACTRF